MRIKAKPLFYCGNCGRRIQAHQPKLEIKNFNSSGRLRGMSYFHETWAGCVESTQQNERYVTTESERILQSLSPSVTYTSMELSE